MWSPVIKRKRNRHAVKGRLRHKDYRLTKKSTAQLKLLKNILCRDIERLTRTAVVIKKEPLSPIEERESSPENKDLKIKTEVNSYGSASKRKEKLPQRKLPVANKLAVKGQRNKAVIDLDCRLSKRKQKGPSKKVSVINKLPVVQKKISKPKTDCVKEKLSTKVTKEDLKSKTEESGQKVKIDCPVCGYSMENPDDFQWAEVIQCVNCKMWSPVYKIPKEPKKAPTRSVGSVLKAFLKPLDILKQDMIINDFENSFLPFYNSIDEISSLEISDQVESAPSPSGQDSNLSLYFNSDPRIKKDRNGRYYCDQCMGLTFERLSAWLDHQSVLHVTRQES